MNTDEHECCGGARRTVRTIRRRHNIIMLRADQQVYTSQLRLAALHLCSSVFICVNLCLFFLALPHAAPACVACREAHWPPVRASSACLAAFATRPRPSVTIRSASRTALGRRAMIPAFAGAAFAGHDAAGIFGGRCRAVVCWRPLCPLGPAALGGERSFRSCAAGSSRCPLAHKSRLSGTFV